MLWKVGEEDADDDQTVWFMSVAVVLLWDPGFGGRHDTRIERAERCQVRPAHGIRGDLGPCCVECAGVGTIQGDGSSELCRKDGMTWEPRRELSCGQAGDQHSHRLAQRLVYGADRRSKDVGEEI